MNGSRIAVAALAAAFVAAGGSAGAQQASPQCTAQQTQVQDACQIAVDIFQYMAPQLGAAIAGGNATLGQGGTLGGFGHFSLGIRANAVDGSVPQVNQITPGTNGLQQRTLPTKDHQPVPMPVADAAFGIFRGIPMGVTNVGGIDVLVNVAYIPSLNQNDLSVSTPNGSLKFGYGLRLGVLQESVLVPGVSVTYLKRDLPEVSMLGQAQSSGGGQDTLSIQNLNVGTTAWRLVASKHFVVFGLAAGVGQDKYSQSASVQANVHDSGISYTSSTFDFGQDVTRTNLFADLSINLPILKLIGEVGQVSGGSASTYNSFGKDVNASRLYGSVGLRFAW
ncbi:MAG: hypothetical protein KGL93_09885 [Gemmatimonadota bacterium]|nr:hypothetical protein [Gemmatimonadota bacterium]